MKEETYPFITQQLPYEYDALEPMIDEDTLHYHHDCHYQAYVNQLNGALSSYPELQKKSIRELLMEADRLPIDNKRTIVTAAGGVFNHALYFDGLKRLSGQDPTGELLDAIKSSFGSVRELQERIKKEAMALVGSGWIFLVALKDGSLLVKATGNMEVPDLKTMTPILVLDVWEHAYYLQYKNKRADYIDSWFGLIHWKKAELRYRLQ